MARRLFPFAGALVLLVGLWLPAFAYGLPDNLGDIQKSSYLCTDTAQANCAPAQRGGLYADNGSGTPVAVQSGDVNNAASASGMVKSLAVCRYNATLPTLTDTRYDACQVTQKGALITALYSADSTAINAASSTADGAAPSALPVRAFLNVFNGSSTNDMVRGSTIGTGILVAAPPDYSYSAVATADAQIKGSAGFLHTCTFAPNDATPTAGTIIVYDNTAESGTVVFNWAVPATAFNPLTVTIDAKLATGIYLGFTTTNDVNVSCSYR